MSSNWPSMRPMMSRRLRHGRLQPIDVVYRAVVDTIERKRQAIRAEPGCLETDAKLLNQPFDQRGQHAWIGDRIGEDQLCLLSRQRLIRSNRLINEAERLVQPSGHQVAEAFRSGPCGAGDKDARCDPIPRLQAFRRLLHPDEGRRPAERPKPRARCSPLGCAAPRPRKRQAAQALPG